MPRCLGCKIIVLQTGKSFRFFYFYQITAKHLLMKKLLIVPAMLVACSSLLAQTNNELTAKEKKQGWHLLFDGKTTTGWHTFHKTTAGPGWTVNDGVLQLDPAVKDDRGDIVTDTSEERRLGI